MPKSKWANLTEPARKVRHLDAAEKARKKAARLAKVELSPGVIFPVKGI